MPLRYRRGCRCSLCRRGRAVYERARYKGTLVRFPAAQHGTRSMYVGGCRCDACRVASRQYDEGRRRLQGIAPRSRWHPSVPITTIDPRAITSIAELARRLGGTRDQLEHWARVESYDLSAWRAAARAENAIRRRQWRNHRVRTNLLAAHGTRRRYSRGCRCRLCKAYMAERQRAWHIANPGKRAALYRRWRKTPDGVLRRRAIDQARRARKLSTPGRHTAADIREQYDRQRGRCFYGRRVNPDCAGSLKRGFHVDHVIPFAGERDASNGVENIVLTCPSCNLRKRNKDPMDFAGIML